MLRCDARALLLLCLGTVGCEAESPSAPSEDDVIEVFERSCGFDACHGGGGAAGGLGLQPVFDGEMSLYDAVVESASCQSELPLVTPGRLEASWLWTKVDPEQWVQGKLLTGPGSEAAGCPSLGAATDGMPPGTAGLSREDLATIRRWIEAL